MREPLAAAGISSSPNAATSVTTLLRPTVFESLMGFWYYQADYLIGGGEISGPSTRPAARYATMRVFVFYSPRPILVVPLPKALLPYPPPFDQSGNRASLLGLTGWRVVQPLTKTHPTPTTAIIEYYDVERLASCMLSDALYPT